MSTEGVAIIGMSCLFPGARPRRVLAQHPRQVDTITDPPPEAWDRPSTTTPSFADTDRIYCKRGGYLGDLARFDPLAARHPAGLGRRRARPVAGAAAGHDALADAGCLASCPRRSAASTGGDPRQGHLPQRRQRDRRPAGLVVEQTLELLRSLHPEHQRGRARGGLRRAEGRAAADSVPRPSPGLIPNVIVGRIANRLDLMGPTYTVDAACASSLVAVQLAMRDLLDGDCDLVDRRRLAGVDAGADAERLLPARRAARDASRSGRSTRTPTARCSARASAWSCSSGSPTRSATATGSTRCIRGVGVASDGRASSVMAPRVEGEELALRRAYEAAGVDPAHRRADRGARHRHAGRRRRRGAGADARSSASASGELPARRARHGQVDDQPHDPGGRASPGSSRPRWRCTTGCCRRRSTCDEPNPKLELETTPFYINTETRPWIHAPRRPRRAGVNAFGFGGINAHAVLEEWDPEQDAEHAPPWDSEVVILEAATPAELQERAQALLARARGRRTGQALADLAHTLGLQVGAISEPRRLAIVAGTLEELQAKLTQAAEQLTRPRLQAHQDDLGDLLRGRSRWGPGRRSRSCFPARARSTRGCSPSCACTSPRSAPPSTASTGSMPSTRAGTCSATGSSRGRRSPSRSGLAERPA